MKKSRRDRSGIRGPGTFPGVRWVLGMGLSLLAFADRGTGPAPGLAESVQGPAGGVEPLPGGWRLEGNAGGAVAWAGETGLVAGGEVVLVAAGAETRIVERLGPGTVLCRSGPLPRLLFRTTGSGASLWHYHYWGRLGEATGWCVRDGHGPSGEGSGPRTADAGSRMPWPLLPAGALGP